MERTELVPTRRQQRSPGGRTYYNVTLGRLDAVNGPAEYPFPTRKAAIKFATFESAVHTQRVVVVYDENGKVILRKGRKAQERRKLKRVNT